MIRELNVLEIISAIKQLCIDANSLLPCSIVDCIKQAHTTERNLLAKDVLSDLLSNLDAATELGVPICQDTGMAVIFAELGQDVHIVGGTFNDAINEGVRQGYIDGNLRCSIVADPLHRINTNDNTPAIIHLSMVAGDKLKLMVAPKGFGSENMSGLKFFNPSASAEDIVDFVCDTVTIAGSNPCPPIVVGVGMGGDFEHCAYLAKKALCRDVTTPNQDEFYASLEQTMLSRINALQIGVQGFGGDTTALAVNIEQSATHIAGLPVAVNIGCHVTRHKTIQL